VKIINAILGVILVFVGWFFLSLTVDNATVKNIIYKIVGFIIVVNGIYFLKKITKKESEKSDTMY